MKEWSIQVDRVVVTATPLAEVYQAVLAEVSNYSPNCLLRQVEVARSHRPGNPDNRQHQENAPLGRQERPIPALGMGWPPARFPLVLRW